MRGPNDGKALRLQPHKLHHHQRGAFPDMRNTMGATSLSRPVQLLFLGPLSFLASNRLEISLRDRCKKKLTLLVKRGVCRKGSYLRRLLACWL